MTDTQQNQEKEVHTSADVAKVEVVDSSSEQQQSTSKDKDNNNNINEQVEGGDNNSELILIQDSAFNVKVHVPGLEPFDLQVTSMELVQEIHQVLMDKEETCHRTCFSLQLDGVTLDNFSELKSVEGLRDGSSIRLVEEPYTVRECRLHVRHVNDLIHSLDAIDAYNGVNCNSLTYVNELTNDDLVDSNSKRADNERGASSGGANGGQRSSGSAAQSAQSGANSEPTNDFQPPEYVLPNCKDVPLLPLHLGARNKLQQQAPACLKQLTFSGWNPPPGKRKMKGDLMYLHVITCEDKRFHITASVKGFFVNQSTDDTFNPKADSAHKTYHALVDLLNNLSATFKKSFALVQKRRTQKHAFERIGTPFQTVSWLSPDFEHTVDWFRAEDANAAKLGHEDHIPGHSRDWNEEIQATRELPKKTLPERLVRERAMFKVHSDFVSAATRGAIAVVESNIMAINPGEDAKIQMYIWNNMFFSLGFDVKDHYKDFGGDYAAYVAPINDLQGVKALNMLDIDGLHTLGTVVVDYKGFRVTVQSIIPGILDKDQEQSVVHGSTDFGKTCATNAKYNELLEKVCSHLKMRPHKIRVEGNDDEIMLYSSIECKGIVGNDSRHYVLDLLRMFPPDLNYLPTADNELSAESQSKSFPRKFRHKLCSLRQELIEAFVDSKYVEFIKHTAVQIQQLNSEKRAAAAATAAAASAASDASEAEVEKAKQLINDMTTSDLQEHSSNILEKACKHVNSWKKTEFDIRFNPNLFQPFVQLADDVEQVESDKKLLNEACHFLLNVQIPQLVKDLLEHSIFISDGVTLTDTLHARGINVRYLGHLLERLAEHESLSYVHTIAINDLVSRCVKRLFRQYAQTVSSVSLSAAVAHFLNCYLSNWTKVATSSSSTSSTQHTNGSDSAATPDTAVATAADAKTNVSSSTSSKKKRKNQRKSKQETSGNEWNSVSSRSLWSQIADEAMAQYHFEIKLENNDEASFAKLGLRKLTLLRSFCTKNGVQLMLRDYSMESKNKEAFHDDDILNMFPVVKHVATKASDAYSFFTNGQTKIQQGFFKDGYELISESYNLLNNVYGALHPEICMCLRLLSRLNYILGEYGEALATQHKAVMMCERLLGVDHSQTITEYAHLALYSFANGQVANSLRLLYRARYLLVLNVGEDHPEMSLIDSNLGLILQASAEYEYALRYLEKALECNKKYFGARSMKTALSYHLVARLQSCRGDFRAALMNERETYQIYRALLGEEHERTKESAMVLKHLTEQAVLLQKKMNEMYKTNNMIQQSSSNGSSELVGKVPQQQQQQSFKMPVHIQQPSLQTVLAMLNIINGIIFIPSHDIEEMRDELNRIQKHEQLQLEQQNQAKTTPASSSSSSDNDKKQSAPPPAQINAQDDDLQ